MGIWAGFRTHVGRSLILVDTRRKGEVVYTGSVPRLQLFFLECGIGILMEKCEGVLHDAVSGVAIQFRSSTVAGI
jgi:hypothetical protein